MSGNERDAIEEPANERCACGAVVEWSDAWERCGAIVVHKGGAPYPTSHARARMGGCFEVTADREG